VNSDIQLFEEVFFGEEGDFERDLEFIDYEGITDSDKFISVGYLREKGERADLAGEFVKVEEIIVK
jgi:hypothetical protein